MAGVDAGEWVPCPACGTSVLAKSMIPVLGEGGHGLRYLCVACARGLIAETASPPASANGAQPPMAVVEGAGGGSAGD